MPIIRSLASLSFQDPTTTSRVIFRPILHRCMVCAPWGDASYNNSKDLCKKTHKIMVFKKDKEQGIGSYTNDIGDLCIFLGENESFCLSASDYPSLNPNLVYFAGHGSGFGICDLASRTVSYLSDSTPPPGRMFWLPATISQ